MPYGNPYLRCTGLYLVDIFVKVRHFLLTGAAGRGTFTTFTFSAYGNRRNYITVEGVVYSEEEQYASGEDYGLGDEAAHTAEQ